MEHCLIMESTEQKRVWNKGDPPHAGWWNASNGRVPSFWRWWNESCWSKGVREIDSAVDAAQISIIPNYMFPGETIEWSDYYPTDALVPRVNPRKDVAVIKVRVPRRIWLNRYRDGWGITYSSFDDPTRITKYGCLEKSIEFVEVIKP